MDTPRTTGRTLRYMRRFRCIGGACEDPCCVGMSIQFDRNDYERLRLAVLDNPADRAVFEARVVRTEGAGAHHATLHQGDRCGFLAPDGLCNVHSRYGHEALPDTCALFPRHLARVGDTLELAATMACPEVARLGLVEEEAVDWVDLEPGDLPRPGRPRQLAARHGDLYTAAFPDVHAALRHLLEQRQHPVRERLFWLAVLGHQVDDFFAPGTPASEAARLERELALVCAPGTYDEVAAIFASAAPDRRLVIRLVRDVLIARLLQCTNVRFNELVRPIVLAPDHVTATDLLPHFSGDPSLAVPDEALAARYESRLAHLEPRFGARIDRYVGNYAANYFAREWYTAAPGLFAHVQRVVFFTAVLRVLLLCHPRLPTADELLTEEALDALAVEVVQTFAKNVEHDTGFLGLIEPYLREQGMHGLAGSALLLAL